MDDWKNTFLDDESMWPTELIVELPEPNVDDRGAIQGLVNLPMKNASIITSKAGTVRSNHYHRTDWHFIYFMSGSAEYHYRPTGSGQEPEMRVIREGEMIFTPPMEDHATLFLEDTVILVLSRNPRDQASYEADVERVTLI